MTRAQIHRLAPGDHAFYAGQLVCVADPLLVRRRSAIRVRVVRLSAPDLVIEAAPAELTPFGRLRRLTPANKALLARLAEVVRRQRVAR